MDGLPFHLFHPKIQGLLHLEMPSKTIRKAVKGTKMKMEMIESTQSQML
jgi:hypothetical protein